MVTVVITENIEKAEEIIAEMLGRVGNINIYIAKEANVIKIMEKAGLKDMVTLEEKIIDLEKALYEEKRGSLYKFILEEVERPLFAQVLARTEGNQLKAAKILGLNRNTMRAKIKKLGINPDIYRYG